MKILAIIVCNCFLALNLFAALTPEYETLKADAEKLFADGSFSKANELYRQVNLTNLPPTEQRWVQFRLADTQWRSQAATQTADTTKLDEARHQLEVLIRDISREEDRDRVWAEVQESLGDFFWTRRNSNNWSEGWPHYQQALDWWAGTHDIELARGRYLKIVWRMAKPPQAQPYYSYGSWGNYIPLDVLENALKISQTDNDKVHAHYLVAMTLRSQGGDWRRLARVPEEFEGAIKIGKSTDWYDDALYNYAEWMTGNGRIVPLDENGNWRQEPDYVKALELFRLLASEFQKGETRYWEQAQQQIKNITEPQVGVSVGNVFLPDSEIQYYLNWRNVKHIELALYPVNLTSDVKEPWRQEHLAQQWISTINLDGREKIKSWARDTKDASDYKPGSETLRLDGKLKPGAYVLEAKSGGKSARELVLVTDATIVLKLAHKQALVYVCDAVTGAPLTNANVKFMQFCHDFPVHQDWYWREISTNTSRDGIATFDVLPSPIDIQVFVAANKDGRQAFSLCNMFARDDITRNGQREDAWKIYAFTDRPAYRPKETVNWKFIARRYDGSVYSTPSEQTIEFEITDPRGAKVKEDKVKLNAFGSAWGSLDLTEQMPLGEYRVTFWDEGRQHHIGNATLFRLEEYKLPEFKVTVQTPEENGSKKSFRLGEKVEATIQADYYFGGPVANATVEVLVHQNPFWRHWPMPREYPWYYEDMDNDSPYGRFGRYYGGGQIIKQETIKTDATGKATLTFDTPANSGQDFEYRIEARVTDASRREITGSGTVRVTRQRYYVDARPEHNLYRPQDKVTVNFKALDANDQPVQTGGTVKVTRDYWYEIWLAPDGHELKGDELKALQSKNNLWPPPPQRPDQRGWQLKFRGYEHDNILTRSLKTATNGAAELSFTPEREGYYRVAWTSDDTTRETQYATFTNHITAETTVWVANNRTTELGYRHSGVEIIADKDTFRVGSKAPVMLVSQTADRYVLFSVEGEDLYSYQLIHLDGTVKLVELPIEEKHVPNIFLNATLVSDRQIFNDTKQIVVPPTKNFLNVTVKSDREQYLPQEEGTLTITTKNDEGNPVSAEVGLSLVDESVFYIQGDYAGDPRQFYFGTKRQHPVQTQSTMNQKSYVKLVVGEKEELIDEREFESQKISRERRQAGFENYDKDGSGMLLNSVDRLAEANGIVTASRGMGGGGGGGNHFYAQNAAMPAPAVPPMLGAAFRSDMAKKPAEMPMRPPAGEEPAVQVRTDFRSTVLWQPDLITDKDGKATVKVKYPDSLTGWKATARVASQDNQFGIADTTTRTKQPLIVRLQAPRFFVVGDTETISAVVNNNTDEAMSVRASIEADGLKQVSVNARDQDPISSWLPTPKVPANGESRVDWTFKVEKPGEVKLKVTGRSAKYTDAMEKTYIAYEHGIEKFIAKSGKVRLVASKLGGDGGNDITVKLDLPHERKTNSTSLTVQVTPSMAVTMLDALPYLIDYPYGCTEQTMSRFLPAAITAKTLRDLGLQPEDVMGRIFGGIETNTAAATHPKGKKDLAELDAITKAGLERLYDFQHADGGWGWWKQGESDHWMTAYVVWGMSLARDAGVQIKQGALDRGASYLDKTLVEEEENYDMQAFMLHALAAYDSSMKKTASPFQTKAFDNLWNNREKLNAYTRALLALSAHYFGKTQEAKTLIENLENGVIRDERPDNSVLVNGSPSTLNSQPSTILGTAHWGEDGIYWRWSDGGVEATAFALRAMLAIDPTNNLVEPVSNWLIKNRRGAQWNSTRDTAIVVLAMNDYLRASGELKTDLEYELIVNGKSIAKKKISGADVFNAPSRFIVDAGLIKDNNEIRIKTSHGSTESRPAVVYFAVEGKFFSTEEPVAPAGNEIFVKREYYKLSPRPTLLKGFVYDKLPLNDGDSVKSGERIETVLTIEAKNNYEYLMFEDLKPAGFEAVEVRSGESLYANELKSGAVERKFGATNQTSVSQAYVVKAGDTLSQIARANGTSVAAIQQANNLTSATIRAGQRIVISRPRPVPNPDFTGRARWVYQELRDRKVALFIDKLPQGVWEIRYNFRAEVPGQFHALPVLGQAMYVPEIRCNGAEVRVNVTDANP